MAKTRKTAKNSSKKTTKTQSKNTSAATDKNFKPPPARLVRNVPIRSIVTEPQARKTFDDGALLELSQSISEVGALQPIVVLDIEGDGSAKYLLITGERRLKAAKLGKTDKNAVILAMAYEPGTLNERDIAKMRIAENFQRVDLNHIETASAMEAYRAAGASIPEIAASVHKSPDFVRDHLRLLDLAPDIQPHVASGRIPIKQAVMIAAVGDHKVQRNITKNAMNPSVQYHHRDRPLAEIAADSDYMSPMKELRDAIQGAIKSLGPCKWPMDKDYAEGPPCTACPHNTLTEPKQWTLLNVKGKKGNCTNEQCFITKTRAWEKDPIKLKADRKLHAAALKAKQKAEKEAAEAAGAAEPPAESPNVPIDINEDKTTSADERYFAALTEYGERTILTMVEHLEENPPPADGLNCVMLIVDLEPEMDYECNIDAERKDPKRKPVGDIVNLFQNHPDEIIRPPHGLTADLLYHVMGRLDSLRPNVEADDDVKIALADMITACQALAKRWGVAIDEPPKFEDFKDEPQPAAEPE